MAEAAEIKDQCATWTMNDCDARYDNAADQAEELQRHAKTIRGALTELREQLSKKRAALAQVTRKDNCARDKTLKRFFQNGLHKEFARWLYAVGAIRQQASGSRPPSTICNARSHQVHSQCNLHIVIHRALSILDVVCVIVHAPVRPFLGIVKCCSRNSPLLYFIGDAL